ncbi:golgin subfamily B member 1-like [Drosophila tropicalis]|uniref:golgin subfamily B member 1-like n=1 Tax=Drosophila tropicalis TaxID=46794 RepID=UPI0035ABE255
MERSPPAEAAAAEAVAAVEADVAVEPPGQNIESSSLSPSRPPPRITFSENSSSLIRCIPNERATLFVKIDCDEEDETELLPFKFEWSRGEIPIENSDRFRITQTSNAVQLAVEHVQREDAGHYTLIARTKSNDVVRRHVELIVEDRSMGEDPPVFVRRLVDLSVKVGTRTRLLTEIRSSTDLKLTWYRNDRRVCENDRITEINEGTFHYLEVSPVTLEDGGQWMLMAENLGGRNSCLGTLNVLVPKAYKTPEFVEELRAVLTEQGTVSLECKVVGVPTPHLRWFKDSKEIKAGDIFALTANADDPTSLGTYTCEARNCMGVTYSSSKVHVVGRGSREGSLKPADNVSNNSPPPIFTNELRDMSVRIGETIILGCQVVVPPWPKSVAWYNTDGRVETSERYKLIEDGLGVYMIEIKPSESCDAGEWKCVVTSFEGCVGISTSVVTMDIPKNYRKPRFMESLRAVLTEEGLVSFECKVVGFPTPVLKWFKDGHELKPGDVYQLTGTNSLGTYCCIARNCMGETSSTAVLTVEDIQNQLTDEERLVFTHQNQAPRFLTGLKSTDAKINEPFQFKVVVRASPDPTLTWFRDELPIDPNDRYNHYRGEDEEWLMDIKAVEFVDQAEWKCVAVNDFGTSITSCFLKLQIPRHYKKPRFLECLRAVLTDEGAVNLECKVIGVPQPVLKWYKDGVELKPGDIHRIISGQDGTCCLGTYTCEARNCMGVVASSASLLGFEDAQRNQTQKNEQQVHENELQRNFSLSTIQEERTSQLYETPVGDITIDDKGDVSFSFDGKEVSVSLYETPDLTEEEALKIVEMYADQISEHVTEHNIVELPPLRFVKETSQSGKLLMEAVVIDIAPEYFSHEDDLRTEADMDDISITEITVHGSSGRDGVGLIDRETQQYVQESFEKMEEELSLSAPVARKRKKSRPTETEEFFSLSKASGSQGDEEETSDLQTFASAQMSTSHNQKQVSAKSEQDQETMAAPKRKKSKKPSDSDSSRTTEDDARLQDISGAVGDGLLMSPASHLKAITDESEINRNLIALVPLAKILKVIENHLTVVEHEVLDQSTMMMTPAAADQSIAIIRNIVEPIKQIESKLRVYSGESQIDALIQSMDDDIRKLHMGLQVIEKCVEIDETGATLIQRTSVCIIDTVGEQMKRALEELKIVSKKFHSESLRAQIELTADDIQQGLEITQGTIKSQALLQEAQDLEAAQHFTETVEKMQQDTNESMSFATISEANLPSEASALKEICQPVAKIQEALERVEMELSLEESEEEIYKKVHQKVLESIVEPIRELQSTLHSIEDKTESLAGTESMEQKINMAILDIVTPPLFELNKGLEVILNEKSDSVEGGMLTVSTVESMVPPLQEIQNGLAQLGQDLESAGGQAALMAHEDGIQSFTEPSLGVADTQKLLQSIAQAVLHFETNIERISSRLSPNVKIRLQNLKDELSALIGTILDKDITRHHVELLEQLKRPIDELNYCIRQTEVKSMTGSLADLIEPLSMLQENTQKGHGLMLTAREPDKQSLQTLENIRSIIRNAVIDIEEHEFKILQQEIQQDEEQASQQQQDKSFSALRKALETKVSLEEAIDNMETLQLALNQINENSKFAKQVKKSATQAQVSLLHILQIAKNLATFSEAETALNPHEANTTRIFFECAKSFGDLAKTLGSPNQDVGCEFKQVLSQFSEIVGQQKKATDEKLPVEGPLASLIQALEHLDQPLKESASVEDLSTLDDISVLKSIAESLPTEPEVELPGLTEKPSLTADVLLSDVNHGISAVLSHCEDFDVTSLVGLSAQQVQAAIIKMQDLQNSIALVHETNIPETAHSLSSESGSHQGTFAEALCSLERCVLHVEECIAQSGIEEISELELSKLKELATPLKDVRQYCEQIYNQVLDQAIDMSTQEDISQLKTSGQNQTEQIGAKETAEVQQEPQVEVFDIQQGVASGIKQLQACLEVTQTTNTEELYQVSQIMKQLKYDLESIQTTLILDTDQQETVLAQAKIAGTMFKLKESLVHTYESGLVDSLETVESAFEDILLSLPILESQLAQEMFAKIEKSLNNFNMKCQQYDTVDQTHQLGRLKGPFDLLLHSIKTLAMQATVDIDKSSIVIVNLQSNLMSAFRALNEVSEKADNNISIGLLKTQSSLVAVFDFIENNESTIRIIELLQEIDAITTELKTLSLVPEEPTVPIDIGVIIENVSSGKAFLTELEEGLKSDKPLSVLLLNENSEDIGQLEATLIQIENEILSQPQLNQITPQQYALIETLQTQLNNFQEKLNYLNISSSESVLATDEELLQSSSEAIEAHKQHKASDNTPYEDQQLQENAQIENLAKISKQKVVEEAQQTDEPENKKPKIIDKQSTDEEIHSEKRKKVNQEQISEQVEEPKNDNNDKIQDNEKKQENIEEAKKRAETSKVSTVSIENTSDQDLQEQPEALLQKEEEKTLEIKDIQEILSEKFEDLSKVLASTSCNDELQSILKETKDTIENLENGEKVAEAMFKLREHIVHTYDGKPLEEQTDREAVEGFIESILEFCPDASKQLIQNYVKEIKTNIILTKAAIQLINESEMFLKPSLLIPKLVNLEHISDETQSKLHLDKSSEKMINLQQNLMDIFIILDDLLDEKTDRLKPQIEDAKTALLKEYDYIEKKQGKLNTVIIQEKIFNITQKMLNISEELQELIASQTNVEEKAKDVVDSAALTQDLNKGEVSQVGAEKLTEENVEETQKPVVKDSEAEAQKAKVLEKKSLKENELDAKKQKQADENAEKKVQQGEVSEVVSEKITEQKVEVTQKPFVKNAEAEAQEAKVLEKKFLEEKELDTKKQNQAKKDVEKEVQQGEVSEVVAEKITDEKVEQTQKPVVKDSEAEAQKAKALEKKSLEEKKLDAKKQKQADENAEKKVQQGEVSEVVSEKITEEKVEDTQKPFVKDAEAEAQKAKVLEKKSLEEKELDAKKQNQAKKDAEKEVQQGEVSEVVAEKITDEKVEETQKPVVKDSEAEAQKAKALEKKSLEEKKLDAKKQKQAEKDAEKKVHQGEISEVVTEKITEEKIEETQKPVVKESEAEAKAIALEKKSLEQKELDAMKQNQAEKRCR